jgi:thymidine kinase
MSLTLIIGPMMSGKTSELIKMIRRYKIINKSLFIINHENDKRYDNNVICSHDKVKEYDVNMCSSLMPNLTSNKLLNTDVIVIEEGQFFSDLYEFVLLCVEKLDKHLIVAGLDGDFRREQFGDICKLVPLADDIIKLKALCSICKDGTPGLFSKRIAASKDIVLVGGSDEYIPVCRKHYKD